MEDSLYLNFINSLKSEETKSKYRKTLLNFLLYYKIPTLEDLLSYTRKDIEQMITNYITGLNARQLSFGYINLVMCAIFHFFDMNDVILNKKKIAKFIGEHKKMNKDRPYTHEEIKLLADTGDYRFRALVLLLASTGARLGSIPSLLYRHLERRGDVYKVTLYEGSKEEHYVFTTPESAQAIDSYIDYRKRASETITPNSPLFRNDFMVTDSQTIKDVIGVLSAKAEFEGEHKTLAVRVADLDNKWYYDLTNDKWEFVEMTAEGWKIINGSIIFRRFNQLPQVYPSKDYPDNVFDRFMNLLNVNGDANRLLLKCYIVSMFIPGIPKVMLMLHGEQGSTKTTLEELIKMLVDPSIVKTLAFPRDINEFIQQLAHNYVAYYDNISLIKDWISDLLCRAVTGSGFSKRVLYSEDDDFIYSLKRCVGFNGINLGATKADLLDRGLIIQLQRLAREKWRKIEDIWKEFEEIRPQLLGYILDIVVKVLAWKKEGHSLDLTLSRMDGIWRNNSAMYGLQ